MALVDQLKQFALARVDKVGIAAAESFVEAPAGSRPTDILPQCKSVVVFAIKHLDVFARSMDKSCQAYSQDIVNHETLHQAYQIARHLEKRGYFAFPTVASVKMFPCENRSGEQWGRISLRHAAQLAGLGKIGEIGIVVTPEFGPRVQLGAVLTDAELPADGMMEENPCISCKRCIRTCPAGALADPGDRAPYLPVDQEKCLAYRKAEGGSSPLGFQNVCSLCRAACPVGT